MTIGYGKADQLTFPFSTDNTKSTLTLPDVDFTDKGDYKCEFVFQQGRISSSPAYLSVRGLGELYVFKFSVLAERKYFTLNSPDFL